MFRSLLLVMGLVAVVLGAVAPDTLGSGVYTGNGFSRIGVSNGGVVTMRVYGGDSLGVSKDGQWASNRWLNYGSGFGMAITGSYVDDSVIAVCGNYKTVSPKDTLMFVAVFDAVTGGLRSEHHYGYTSYCTDVVRVGDSLVVLGRLTNYLYVYTYDLQGNSGSVVFNLMLVSGLNTGHIRKTSNGLYVITYFKSGVDSLFMKAFGGAYVYWSGGIGLPEVWAWALGSKPATAMVYDANYGGGFLELRNDTPFVAYYKDSTWNYKWNVWRMARGVFFDGPVQRSPLVRGVVTIPDTQVVLFSCVQDVDGYLMASTGSGSHGFSRNLYHIHQTGVDWQKEIVPYGATGDIRDNLVLRPNGELIYAASTTTARLYTLDREGRAAFAPTAVSFTYDRSHVSTSAQSVSISNSNCGIFGPLTAQVSYTSDAGWLSVVVTGSGNAQTASNNLDTSKIPIVNGQYTATVSFGGDYLSLLQGASYTVTLDVTGTTQVIAQKSPVGVSRVCKVTAYDFAGRLVWRGNVVSLSHLRVPLRGVGIVKVDGRVMRMVR